MNAPGQPGHPVHYRSGTPLAGPDGATTYRVHEDPDVGLVLEVAVLAPGASVWRTIEADRDETLYVLGGSGVLVDPDGAEHRLDPDHGGRAHDEMYGLRNDGDADWEVVLVSGRSNPGEPCPAPVRALDLHGRQVEEAVSEREFQVLHDPETGCSGLTQFVGFVPQVRTPRHYHPYSEMLCIVRGRGTVEIDGQVTDVGPGDCYYLPAGCVHLVQNTADEHLVELGVFTPAGSPAQNTPVE